MDVIRRLRHAAQAGAKRGVFVAVALVGLTAAGCGGSESGVPTRRTLIDSRDGYDPRSLDPALSTDVPTGRAVAYLFDGLTRFTERAEVVPDLARSWEVSQDGLTYTFHLARNVHFHDGTPFSAADVKHSFVRVLDPKTRGGRGWPLYPILGAREYAQGKDMTIAGLVVLNDSTVRMTLTEPFAIFPKMLAMPVTSIVPQRIPADFGEHPIGTGPWKFVEWRHDDYLLFARNRSYHGGAPNMDSLETRIIPEPSTAVAEFESGNVDILSVPDRETHSWEENDEQRPLLQSAPSLRLIYVAVNTTHGPLADVRVRQALNYAIDRGTVLDRLLGGRGTLAAGVIPPALDGFDPTRRPYPYDTVRARALLREAGYPNGIDLKLWCSQSDPFPRIAQTIQAYLAQANIRVMIVERDASSMREAARHGTTDLALKDWFADYPDAENFLYPLLHSVNAGVGGNVSFYKNAIFDSIVSTARREQNSGKRAQLYLNADSIAFHDAPMIFLFFYKDLDAIQPWIRGFVVPSIFNGQRWKAVSIVHAAPKGQ
ncbi:MAG TPA: ABC transporter substrate-binding protein [Gemmatimonadaceae bacterium]|jgi:ABC-type transport system substrate-binding protein|nr:ABC transporter substrate-binding protein [Gemmatimonadaceae bacterium]